MITIFMYLVVKVGQCQQGIQLVPVVGKWAAQKHLFKNILLLNLQEHQQSDLFNTCSITWR